ncbi:MAG: hypothetical protein LBT98_01550 [Puniceicoccales bacterium]|jgi:hypothetical protein|nr:hypothetical protein [Puniceicoccales bacterium]
MEKLPVSEFGLIAKVQIFGPNHGENPSDFPRKGHRHGQIGQSMRFRLIPSSTEIAGRLFPNIPDEKHWLLLGSGPVKPHSTSTWKSDRYGPVVQDPVTKTSSVQSRKHFEKAAGNFSAEVFYKPQRIGLPAGPAWLNCAHEFFP